MIVRACIEDVSVLSELGVETFVSSHRESAPVHEINKYLRAKYNETAIRKELSNSDNIYHIIKYDNKVAGFSKMELDVKHPAVIAEHTSKMDQIYLLNSFHGLQLGAKLLQFNIEYSKSCEQKGMWLIVWRGNKQAITFYEKFGFEVVAEEIFNLTASHTSPCYVMLLKYKNNVKRNS
jgi:ribosomal protein S18 acetylase RimI-like enzyme